MEIEVILILVCIVLAAFAVYQTIRVSGLRKEVGNQEFLVEAKDDIIRSLNADKKMLKAQIDAGSAKRKELENDAIDAQLSFNKLNALLVSKSAKIVELEDQVSMLVSQGNQVGLRRGANGRFVSAD